MLGREVSTPTSLLIPLPPSDETSQQLPWIESLHNNFQNMYSKVVETTKQSQRFQKTSHDKRQKGYKFLEGDLVQLSDPKPCKGRSYKLDAQRWNGPFRVEKRLSEVVYLVKRSGAKSGRIVNVDRLAPFVERNTQRFPALNNAEDQQMVNDEVRVTIQPPNNELDNVRDETEVTDMCDNSGVINNEQGVQDERLLFKRPMRSRHPPLRLKDYEMFVDED
jgi:hypothetical protein